MADFFSVIIIYSVWLLYSICFNNNKFIIGREAARFSAKVELRLWCEFVVQCLVWILMVLFLSLTGVNFYSAQVH